MHKSFTTGADAAVSVWLYTSDAFKSLENDPFPSARAIAKAQGFTGGAGQMVLVPGTDAIADCRASTIQPRAVAARLAGAVADNQPDV